MQYIRKIDKWAVRYLNSSIFVSRNELSVRGDCDASSFNGYSLNIMEIHGQLGQVDSLTRSKNEGSSFL